MQASVEVQTAARRVVEENRRLRELLRYHGVSERSIEGHLATGGGDDDDGEDWGRKGGFGSGNVVRKLEELLNPVEGASPSGRSRTCMSEVVSPTGSVPTTSEFSTDILSRLPSPKADAENGKNSTDNNCSMAADL